MKFYNYLENQPVFIFILGKFGSDRIVYNGIFSGGQPRDYVDILKIKQDKARFYKYQGKCYLANPIIKECTISEINVSLRVI